MPPVARTGPSWLRRAGTPRVVLSLALALLMVVGVWTATHTEAAAPHMTSACTPPAI